MGKLRLEAGTWRLRRPAPPDPALSRPLSQFPAPGPAPPRAGTSQKGPKSPAGRVRPGRRSLGLPVSPRTGVRELVRAGGEAASQGVRSAKAPARAARAVPAVALGARSAAPGPGDSASRRAPRAGAQAQRGAGRGPGRGGRRASGGARASGAPGGPGRRRRRRRRRRGGRRSRRPPGRRAARPVPRARGGPAGRRAPDPGPLRRRRRHGPAAGAQFAEGAAARAQGAAGGAGGGLPGDPGGRGRPVQLGGGHLRAPQHLLRGRLLQGTPQVPHRLPLLPAGFSFPDQDVAPQHLRDGGCVHLHSPPAGRRPPERGAALRAVEPHPERQDHPPERHLPPQRAQHLLPGQRGRIRDVQEVEREQRQGPGVHRHHPEAGPGDQGGRGTGRCEGAHHAGRVLREDQGPGPRRGLGPLLRRLLRGRRGRGRGRQLLRGRRGRLRHRGVLTPRPRQINAQILPRGCVGSGHGEAAAACAGSRVWLPPASALGGSVPPSRGTTCTGRPARAPGAAVA